MDRKLINPELDRLVTKADLIDCSSSSVRELYNIDQKLGSGTFGTVYLVRNKATGDLNAMKEIVKNRISPHEGSRLLEEMNLLKELV